MLESTLARPTNQPTNQPNHRAKSPAEYIRSHGRRRGFPLLLLACRGRRAEIGEKQRFPSQGLVLTHSLTDWMVVAAQTGDYHVSLAQPTALYRSWEISTIQDRYLASQDIFLSIKGTGPCRNRGHVSKLHPLLAMVPWGFDSQLRTCELLHYI